MNGCTIDIIKAHQQAQQAVGEKVSLQETSAILNHITAIQPGSSCIDIGKVAFTVRQAGLAEGQNELFAHVTQALADVADSSSVLDEPRDIVLYGFLVNPACDSVPGAAVTGVSGSYRI